MLSVENLRFAYPGGPEFLFNLTIAPGEIVTLSGPSGSGKTPLLNLLGGLDVPTAGTVELDGQELGALSAAALASLRLHKLGFVFQAYNLIPVFTARENVEFVMQLQGVPAAERRRRAVEILAEVGLAGLEEKRPLEMSGGQQQRVGVARALAPEPGFLLMDEPFGALDALTRHTLQQQVLSLKHELQKTIVFVTHDIFEALAVGDRLAVMHAGDLQQVGTPEEVLGQPATKFVRDLFSKPAKQLAAFRDTLE